MTADDGNARVENGRAQADYSPMLERLVDGADDRHDQLVGIVAYGLYKIAKREWTVDLRREMGRKPNEEELRGYIRAWTESRVDGLRAEAADLLSAFSRDVINEAAAGIREQAIAGEIRSSLGRFEASSKLTPAKIIGNVLLSMSGALFYTLLLFLVLLALRLAGVDILTVAGSVDHFVPAIADETR